MKCKICGHRTTTLNAMRKHYMTKHPANMKRRKHHIKPSKAHMISRVEGLNYCPVCGKPL